MQKPVMVRWAGACLAASEVGLGSLLHGMGIPFAGHFLSLNQCVLLTLVAKESKQQAEKQSAISNVNSVSLFGAMAKAWSPAGKKLTPMLAISVQGILYSLGLVLGGVNFLGVVLGCFFSSAWGFLQPVLITYLLFGKTFLISLIQGAEMLLGRLDLSPIAIGIILLFLFCAKALLAMGLGGAVWSSRKGEMKYRYLLRDMERRVPIRGPITGEHGSIWGGIRQGIGNRWFLLSLAVSIVFFYFSAEHDASGIWKFLLRPVAGVVVATIVGEILYRVVLKRIRPLLESGEAEC